MLLHCTLIFLSWQIFELNFWFHRDRLKKIIIFLILLSFLCKIINCDMAQYEKMTETSVERVKKGFPQALFLR